MALHANYQKIDNWEALYEDAPGGKKLGVVWETLVLFSMPVGLGQITEGNVDEWWFRLKVLEKLHGPAFTSGTGEKFDFGYSDVRRMIGLTTNVSNISRAKFMANCKLLLAEAGEREARYGKRKWDQEQAEAERLGQPPELWNHPLNQEARRAKAKEEREMEIDAIWGTTQM